MSGSFVIGSKAASGKLWTKRQYGKSCPLLVPGQFPVVSESWKSSFFFFAGEEVVSSIAGGTTIRLFGELSKIEL